MEDINLAGKWKYFEDYGYGKANGELIISQDGSALYGKIIFTDDVYNDESFMIQEIVVGRILDNRVLIDATSWDIIHSKKKIVYELDSWIGKILSPILIRGKNLDENGFEGFFEFKKMV